MCIAPATAPLSLTLTSEDETRALAGRLSRVLGPGDTLLLRGPIGAGKTALARTLIHALQARAGDPPEDVPSPTFTLVQTYLAGPLEIWHADLYRLSHPEEVIELGLDEAFEHALCLVEWPDRLGDLAPGRALLVTLSPGSGETVRMLTIDSPDPTTRNRIAPALTPEPPMPERAEALAEFLACAGWADAIRAPLAGDASNRRYDRLTGGPGGRSAVLMDADPASGEDVKPFLAIARHLTALGLSAPAILSEDTRHGFLLLEDLGDDLFARVTAREPALELPLYEAAVDLLVELHRSAPPDGLAAYDASTMAGLACLPFDWYLPPLEGSARDEEREAFRAEIETLLRSAVLPSVLILRDYHAENLLWLPGRSGAARVGLLDFQDALVGHTAYDLVSLLEDARRDVPEGLQVQMRARYVAAAGCDPEQFAAAYALCGAQRNLRILGVFARLCVRDGKPGYLPMMPRVWGHLMRDLSHPALAGLRDRVLRALPPPTPDRLERIAARCARRP